ncbi:MAG: hypothetical protein ACXWP4_19045 [Polyangiales bacterium]
MGSTFRATRFVRGLALLAAPALVSCNSRMTESATSDADATSVIDADSLESGVSTTDSFSGDVELETSADTSIDTGPPPAPCVIADGGTLIPLIGLGGDAGDIGDGGLCYHVVGCCVGSRAVCPPGWTCTVQGCVSPDTVCERTACGSIYCASELSIEDGGCSSPGFCTWGSGGGPLLPPDLAVA